MSAPTANEQALAARWGLPAAQVANARDLVNGIAGLDWPEPERVSLLARLARQARADVGTVYARATLRLAPIASFEAVLPILGVGEKRAAGLARALGTANLAALAPASTALRDALAREAALRAEVAALRAELDRRPGPSDGEAGGAGAAAPMRLREVAQSIVTQVRLAEQGLSRSARGLRLGAVALDLQGRAQAVDGDVALDFADTRAASRLSLALTPSRPASEAASGSAVRVPDVAGYTETLARRKLLAAGYAAITLRTRADAEDRGATAVVRRQVPAAGTPAPTGAAVRIVVG